MVTDMTTFAAQQETYVCDNVDREVGERERVRGGGESGGENESVCICVCVRERGLEGEEGGRALKYMYIYTCRLHVYMGHDSTLHRQSGGEKESVCICVCVRARGRALQYMYIYTYTYMYMGHDSTLHDCTLYTVPFKLHVHAYIYK